MLKDYETKIMQVWLKYKTQFQNRYFYKVEAKKRRNCKKLSEKKLENY